MKTALVTGAPGQDFSYMSELLLEKGYNVVGTCKYSSTDQNKRFEGLEHILEHENFTLETLDITDNTGCFNIIDRYKPDELYNLAAASHVGESFKNPISVFNINTIGVINLLEGIRQLSPETKMFHSSTSEMFGSNYTQDFESPDLCVIKADADYNAVGNEEKMVKFQDERTPLEPNSPYAAAKVAAHNMMRIYRESYGLFTCCGITFNHGSPRRGEQFVTRKITKYVASLKKWLDSNEPYCEPIFDNDNITLDWKEGSGNSNSVVFPKLRLGNVDAVRDWSYAGDMVEGFYAMLQQEKPKDYVFASGSSFTVRDFLKAAFSKIGIANYNDYWVVDQQFFRPNEVEFLEGRSNCAKMELGWEPKVSFLQLVSKMVDSDLEKLNNG